MVLDGVGFETLGCTIGFGGQRASGCLLGGRYYHEFRPHHDKGNLPLWAIGTPDASDSTDDIVCDEFLGGHLRHYRHAAAA